MSIVLIGFMGTGKTAIGKALAARQHARFVDLDAEIERENGKHVADIFTQEGEAAFRRMETMMLSRLVRETGPMVLSTGGGTPLLDVNVRLLKQIGPIVWLTAPPQTILGRVKRNLERRPLLAGHAQDPVARIQQLLTERTPRYAAVQDYEFDTSNFEDPADAVRCILALLADHKEPCQPQHKTAPGSQPPKKKTIRLGLNRG